MMKYILVSIAFLSTILFAEKVSFKEIENVAINYYRQNIAYNQFVNGIITDYEKAINPDSIDFDLDSLVFKNLTVSYIFNINPTGYIQVRAVNALPPIASWSEKCFKEIDNSPPKTPEPGALTVKPRNSTYNHYYAYNCPKDFKCFTFMFHNNFIIIFLVPPNMLLLEYPPSLFPSQAFFFYLFSVFLIVYVFL